MPASDITYEFKEDVEPAIGMTGFSPPEDGFIWSTGAWSEITFPAAKATDGLDIFLDLDVYKFPAALDGQNLFIYVNGLRLASRYVSKRVTILLELPAAFVRPTGNLITIDTPDATCPQDHGGQDTRRLGIQLFSLRIAAG